MLAVFAGDGNGRGAITLEAIEVIAVDPDGTPYVLVGRRIRSVWRAARMRRRPRLFVGLVASSVSPETLRAKAERLFAELEVRQIASWTDTERSARLQ